MSSNKENSIYAIKKYIFLACYGLLSSRSCFASNKTITKWTNRNCPPMFYRSNLKIICLCEKSTFICRLREREE